MELTKLHKDLLVRIHDSENEKIDKSQFVEIKLNHPDLEQTIDDLEKAELVELEIKENSYFLTYEGYELVEQIKNPPKVKKLNRKTNTEEYNEMVELFGGAKNFNVFVIVVMSIVGMLFAYMFYMDSSYL